MLVAGCIELHVEKAKASAQTLSYESAHGDGVTFGLFRVLRVLSSVTSNLSSELMTNAMTKVSRRHARGASGATANPS